MTIKQHPFSTGSETAQDAILREMEEFIQCPGRNVLFKKHNLESSLVVYFIIFEILLLANLQTCYIYAVAIFYKYFIGYEDSLKFWWNYIHVCFGSAPTYRNIFFYSAVAWYLGGCKFSTSCIWILQISDSPFFPIRSPSIYAPSHFLECICFWAY